MKQLVIEYLAKRHDRLVGQYEQVRTERHPDSVANVVDRALKVSTKRGQPVAGYAPQVWRRWWYEDQPTKQPIATEEHE